MRFLSLDLIRYGHFSDRNIALRPDAGLHIIYGPNEAGKSSALAAISDLLFGVQTDGKSKRSSYSFLHEQKDLRIGATIKSQKGGLISFRRRHGRQKTLLEDTDHEKALNDDALAPYIGGLTREVFERAFGLDSERLRSGADEMLADGGEIGQLLFSAASGLTGLKEAGNTLIAEADQIYAPRKSQNRSFYQALDRYDAARKTERLHELNASDWNKLLKEEREIDDALGDLRKRQRSHQTRISDLQRLQQLRGLLAEMDRYAAALTDFSELETVTDEAGERLEALRTEREKLDADATKKRSDLKAIMDSLTALHIDEKLLEKRSEISRLRLETALYSQAKERLPEAQRRLSETETALITRAQSLGLKPDTESEKLCPDNMLRASIKETLDEGRQLQRDEKTAHEALAGNRETLENLQQRSEGEQLVDPSPLRRRYDALRPEMALLAEADQLITEVDKRERQLVDDAAAFRPLTGNIFDLSIAVLPSLEDIRRHRDTIAHAEQKLRESESVLATLLEERSALEQAIAGDRRGAELPSRLDIDAARRHRDALWEEIEDHIGIPVCDWPMRWDRQYRDAVSEADNLGDRVLTDAEQVARRADMLTRHEAVTSKYKDAETTVTERRSDLENARAAYSALFSDAEITPANPDGMLEWRRNIDGLIERRSELLALKARLRKLNTGKDALRESLSSIVETIDVSVDRAMPLVALTRFVEVEIQRLADRWENAREHEANLTAARQNMARSQAVLQRLEERQKVFSARLSSLLKQTGLAGDSTLAAVAAALDIWDSVPELIQSREGLKQTIGRDQALIAVFEQSVVSVVKQVAPDLAGNAPDQALEALDKRIAEQTEFQARKQGLSENAAVLDRDLDNINEKLSAIDTELHAIISVLPPDIDPQPLPQRIRERIHVQHNLNEARRRFGESSNGANEDAVRMMANELDHIACNLEIDALTADERDNAIALETLLDRRSTCRRRREEMERGESAEQAAFDRQSAETEARDLARDWVVLKLAGGLLDAALERYRQGRSDPVLAAASAHFKTLTRGAFNGLTQHYGEDDALVLSAQRANGDDVPVSGLSDGTRDQLYLALRLAFLEDYASRNEPAPLIVDDIFQTFDDSRTESGLKALSGIKDVQAILFTHERSLVEIAGKTLGKSADIITLEG